MIQDILLAYLLTFTTSFTITKLFNEEEPFGMLLDYLLQKTNNNIFLLLFNILITCLKCTSFWTGLLIGNYFDIPYYLLIATTSFIIAMIYDKFLSSWERKIRLQ